MKRDRRSQAPISGGIVSETSSELIRAVVQAALKRHALASDPVPAWLRQARVGHPVVVRSEEDEPAFWLIPLLEGDLSCGYAVAELDGQLTSIASLGAGAGDRGSWLPATFFDHPPEAALIEINAAFGGPPGTPVNQLAEPGLYYDRSRARWGWRVIVSDAENHTRSLFISPGGWYETKPFIDRNNTEG